MMAGYGAVAGRALFPPPLVMPVQRHLPMHRCFLTDSFPGWSAFQRLRRTFLRQRARLCGSGRGAGRAARRPHAGPGGAPWTALGAVHDDPAGDDGLALAVPAEDLARRHLGIPSLDLALLADVRGQDAERAGLGPMTSGMASRCSTQLSRHPSIPGLGTENRPACPAAGAPAAARPALRSTQAYYPGPGG